MSGAVKKCKGKPMNLLDDPLHYCYVCGGDIVDRDWIEIGTREHHETRRVCVWCRINSWTDPDKCRITEPMPAGTKTTDHKTANTMRLINAFSNSNKA